jgi:hypothetical protein
MNKLTASLILLWAIPSGCDQPLSPPTAPFASSSRLAVGTVPGSVELADLNGDGKRDIVVANTGSSNLTILLGDGRGAFTPAPGSPIAAGEMPNDIAIADYNHDAKLDLAVVNHESNQVTVFLGNGRGEFARGPQSPIIVQSKPHAHGIGAGDFNGDQKLDLVVESWGPDQVEVLFGKGDGTFITPGPLLSVGRRPYQRLRAGDFNNDGMADIVTTNSEGDSVTLLLGGKDGIKESAGSPFPAGKNPFGVAVGDLNQDRNLDLAVVNYSGKPSDLKNDGITLLLGDGRGGFKIVAGSPFATGAAPTRIAIGDINGDGFPDVAASNSESQNVTILLGSNKGDFSGTYKIPSGREPKGIAIGDLNGDRKAEIVIANASDNDVMLIFVK